MKFKNIKTGAVLEPNSKFTEEQMEKSNLYVEINVSTNGKKKEEKNITVSQIKEKLDELGIEYDENATKADLLTLLPQKG